MKDAIKSHYFLDSEGSVHLIQEGDKYRVGFIDPDGTYTYHPAKSFDEANDYYLGVIARVHRVEVC